MQFRTGAKRTETARTDCEDTRLEPGDWKQFHKHPKVQFTHIIDDEFTPQSYKEIIFSNVDITNAK